MTAATLRQLEEAPETRPGLEVDGVALSPELAEAIWARIETYVAHRWTVRGVVWVVEGAGDWTPPLHPARIVTLEVWDGHTDAWQLAEARPSPLGGYVLLHAGPWRVSAVVGEDNPPPPAVQLAAALLASYLRQRDELRGLHHATRVEHVEGFGGEDGPEERLEVERPATWLARAMQYSGAADALRQYRRAP